MREARGIAEDAVLFERQWPTWAAHCLKRRDDPSPLVLEQRLQGPLHLAPRIRFDHALASVIVE
ncbi:MAG: hypothetical protein ACO1SV_15980 [Fimbriimonas sp.]